MGKQTKQSVFNLFPPTCIKSRRNTFLCNESKQWQSVSLHYWSLKQWPGIYTWYRIYHLLVMIVVYESNCIWKLQSFISSFFFFFFKRNKHFSPRLKLKLNWVGQTCPNSIDDRWSLNFLSHSTYFILCSTNKNLSHIYLYD